jgi:Ser/Thr protein kinase RdoA (MazF antagonist)
MMTAEPRKNAVFSPRNCMTMPPELRPAALAALRHYDRLAPLPAQPPAAGTGTAPLLAGLADAQVPAALVSPLGGGLINHTFLIDTAALGQEPPVRAVLQRVNPLFGLAVNKDIAAVTEHLHARGMPTPLLYPTRDGAPAVDLGPGGVWRLMTLMPGVAFAKVDPPLAYEAGQLVARFHRSLLELQHRFYFTRPGAHDLGRHLATLRAAVAKAPTVEGLAADFLPLAAEILERAAELPLDFAGPQRLCHGDLKISNLLFLTDAAAAPRGHCLVDLDTLAYLPLGLELGDALRSWCNPDDENNPAGRFDLERFTAAVSGYAVHGAAFVTAEEQALLVPGTLRVALQLAARFAADVVNQSYFGWDPTRFESRAAHNLVRARGQLSLARSLSDQRAAAAAVVARLFAAPASRAAQPL